MTAHCLNEDDTEEYKEICPKCFPEDITNQLTKEFILRQDEIKEVVEHTKQILIEKIEKLDEDDGCRDYQLGVEDTIINVIQLIKEQ